MLNFFNKIPDFNNSQTSADSTFKIDSQGQAIFNDYFQYALCQVFLDNYGGIVFSTCIWLILYFLVKVAYQCLTNKNSKIQKILIATAFEKSVLKTILVSQCSYLWSALILKYAFIPPNGAYQQIRIGFVIVYTIIIAFILIPTISVSFDNGKNETKLNFNRPLFGLITLLCQEYRNKAYLGRIMTFGGLNNEIQAMNRKSQRQRIMWFILMFDSTSQTRGNYFFLKRVIDFSILMMFHELTACNYNPHKYFYRKLL